MKTIWIAGAVILSGLAGYTIAAYAQSGGGAKADPVKVDAKHYKLEFENESVRVLRIKYGAGEKSVMHYHPNSVAVYLSGGSSRLTMPDGKTQDASGKAGDTMWAPAGAHLPENTGTKPYELILVEMKK